MASLGTFLLLASFVACSYATVISVAGARRGSRRLIESGIGAFYLVCALMTVASAVIVNAFLTGDYSIKYVHNYSDSVQPLFYKFTSYWGGLDGSIMFWVFLLSVFGSIAVYVNRERHRELIPYVVAVISTVQMFFLYLMVVHKNPFTTFLTEVPADGRGLNPLLQNYWMVIHPPSLYTGFVGMTIPYAFGMAALITGHLDDSWLRAVRRWTMISWIFLSFGLTLGMIWAYEVLGWGGFWGWDPVENAGLLPWFTATAFLHSVIVQERRSMLRIWNVTLVIVTFFLTIFGTFMTRSGVVQSVHAFGSDPILARLFTGFMVVILVFSFGLVIYRLPLLRARNELDSWVSREAAFLLNNWILLFSALFVLFATMFPTLSEALVHERITVGPPFFNKWMAPIGLFLLFLTGFGPLLAWRKSTLSNLRDQFLWPTLAALVTGGALAALGVRVWSSGLCFAMSAFVTGTITQEFWRGTNVRRGVTGTDAFTALVGLVGRNKRRYGGYIVHLGIMLMFLGFAGSSFKREQQVQLKVGEQTTLGRYTLRNDGVKVSDDGQKQMVTGYISVFKDGKPLDTMYPGKWFFRKHESEPTTQVAIRRTVAEDLYIVLAFQPSDLATQSASLQINVNPLVDWVWFGFAIMALGTGIALLPERTYAFALAKLPEAAAGAAATTTVALLFAFLLFATPVFAQMEAGTGVMLKPINPLEHSMRDEIGCTCGGCEHEALSKCPCGQADQMRGELRAQVELGKTREEIISHFIAMFGGQQFLRSPIDKGFNRLAWLFPYLVGTIGLVVVGVTARRWSRHPDAPDSSAAEPPDQEIEERLDDELRNLD
jgi:cytochrome c-type biogenesis protein CcmF